MKNVHIVGIGGISLSALAKILLHAGYKVSGSDACRSKLTESLEKSGIKVFYKHMEQNVHGADLVVYTGAVDETNPEIVEAKKLKIKCISRAELLGMIAYKHKKVISVAGTHGKTTTTGMLATIFLMAHKNPTVHIGGELPIINGNVHLGGKKYFITEACEYKDSFLSLTSDYSILLNIQKDHMDYFKNMDNLQNSFEKFAKNTKYNGYVIANFDDQNCRKIDYKCDVISYGFNDGALVQAKNIRENNQVFSYDLYVGGKYKTRINLSVPGRHNIYNSLASICVAIKEKIPLSTIKKALASYVPSKRRYDKVTTANGAVIVHDYAHHPTELSASMKIARATTKNKLIVVFEPHTYSRTQYLWKEFCACFKQADIVFVPPIYPAREKPIKGITNVTLARGIREAGKPAKATKSLQSTYNVLQKYDKAGNTIMLLGAGTIVHLAEKFGIN